MFFRILSLITHEAWPRPGGKGGRLSVSHFTYREDRLMRLLQWAGPVTKHTRHQPITLVQHKHWKCLLLAVWTNEASVQN